MYIHVCTNTHMHFLVHACTYDHTWILFQWKRVHSYIVTKPIHTPVKYHMYSHVFTYTVMFEAGDCRCTNRWHHQMISPMHVGV